VVEVAEFDLIRETRPICLDPVRSDLIFKKSQTYPTRHEPDLTRPDLRSNDFQSNQNLSKI
jgi:hypothetical protein